jgi:hypothetical protein
MIHEDSNCFEPIRRREDFVIFISQSIDKDLAKLGIVVSNENIFHATVLNALRSA